MIETRIYVSDNLGYTSFLYDNTLAGMIGVEPITLSDKHKQNPNVCTPTYTDLAFPNICFE